MEPVRPTMGYGGGNQANNVISRVATNVTDIESDGLD